MYSQKKETITKEFSSFLTKSKRKPFIIESDRGGELYNSTLQNLLKSKNIQHDSRLTDKDPSIAQRVIRTIKNLLKKQVFEKETLIGLVNYHLLLNKILPLFITQ